MRAWEEGVLDGSTPYFTLLGGYEGTRRWYNPLRYLVHKFYNKPLPVAVVKFMQKEMFQGKDKEIIESLYSEMYV